MPDDRASFFSFQVVFQWFRECLGVFIHLVQYEEKLRYLDYDIITRFALGQSCVLWYLIMLCIVGFNVFFFDG